MGGMDYPRKVVSETVKTFKIKERRDGLTQERVNKETLSLWYMIKDFLEELYLYISRTIKQKGEWEYRVYTQSPGQV